MCVYVYLRVCCVGCREEFAGESIPTLREAVDLCKKLDLLMFLELKEKADKVIPSFIKQKHAQKVTCGV